MYFHIKGFIYIIPSYQKLAYYEKQNNSGQIVLSISINHRLLIQTREPARSPLQKQKRIKTFQGQYI